MGLPRLKRGYRCLRTIIAQTLKYRSFVLLGVLVLIAFGVYSYLNLPIDAFPDVTNVQVEILSTAPGLSALEIERFVTYPIENAMRGLPDVVQMRSITKFGLSVVTIVFKDNVDIYFARQLVFQRLEEANGQRARIRHGEHGTDRNGDGRDLPVHAAGTANARQIRTQRNEYLTDLRTLQEWVVTPLLKSVAGVNEINSFGGYFKQYQVMVNPAKLVAYNLTLDDVYRAIEKNNENVGGNVLDRFDEQYIVRGVGLLKSEDDLRNIVLTARAGTPVFVRDVADVQVGEAVRQGAALMNGEGEAVGGIVMMLRGENGRAVVER